MISTTKRPSSAPPAFQDEKKELSKSRGKGVRPEPRSDSTGTRSCPGDLDSLSEEQLRKLTKANTKKNHGGRSSRLRSQVERVFRRLDNLAADVKLQPRYSMDALPIVSPRNSKVSDQQGCCLGAERNESRTSGVSSPIQQCCDYEASNNPEDKTSFGIEQKLDQVTLENEEFEIEPATNNSGFTYSSNSLGMHSGSNRSVRISSSVTVLDYVSAQPTSVARIQIFEHPTRTGKCLQTRKHLADETIFPRVLQRVDQGRTRENHAINGDTAARGYEEHETMSRSANSKSPSPPPRRVRSEGLTSNACIKPVPGGPYGPPSCLR